MEDLRYWIWLSRIENVRKKVLYDLLEEYRLPEKIWNLNKDELIQLGLSKAIADNITNEEYKRNLDKYLQYMKKNRIEIITIYSRYYPENLKEIYDPPLSIYVKGNKEILNNLGIAIIGCRKATMYGENTAKKFAYNLSKANINIISGGARGIDTYAHLRYLGGKR